MSEKNLSDIYFEELTKIDFKQLLEQLEAIRGYTQEYFEETVKDYKQRLERESGAAFEKKWESWVKSKNDWIDMLTLENVRLKKANEDLTNKLHYLESLVKSNVP